MIFYGNLVILPAFTTRKTVFSLFWKSRFTKERCAKNWKKNWKNSFFKKKHTFLSFFQKSAGYEVFSFLKIVDFGCSENRNPQNQGFLNFLKWLLNETKTLDLWGVAFFLSTSLLSATISMSCFSTFGPPP